MKIFLSSLGLDMVQAVNSLELGSKPNVLNTFYGLTNPQAYTHTHRSKIGKLILDCGAFSNNSRGLQGAELEMAHNSLAKAHLAYLKRTHQDYDMVFSMDDRFDADFASFEHNLDRLHALEEAGVRAVPVVHNLERDVDYFIEKKYPVVAIGQCPGQRRTNPEVLYPVVERMYQNGIMPHLFGMASYTVLSLVPAYSCDAKTWMDYATRGLVLYWNPKSPAEDKTEKIYFPMHEGAPQQTHGVRYQDYPHLDDFKSYIGENLNLEFSDLLGLKREFNRKLVNVLYFLLLEQRLNELQAKMGITFDK